MAHLSAFMIMLIVPAIVFTRPTERELVDLSYVYNSSMTGVPSETPFQLTIIQNRPFDDHVWVQFEDILTGTHWGTHVDAPCHLVKGRWTIEQIPLKHFIAPAAVVDITQQAAADPDALLQASDLESWEQSWNRTLNNTIVLVRTGWGSRWPNSTYLGTSDKDFNQLHFPGVSGEAAQWLVDNRKIYGVGIDTMSLDSGVNVMRGVPAHMALLDANNYVLENVANMQKLPGYVSQLYVFPMRLGGEACGSPTRIVAILS